MVPVLIESPYAGDVERNVAYAKRAMKDCIRKGEAPMAGHLLYTQILDDTVPQQRTLGIQCHIAWMGVVERVIVYQDYGISNGMAQSIDVARREGKSIIYRKIGENCRIFPNNNVWHKESDTPNG